MWKHRLQRRLRRAGFALAMLALAANCTGCVQRRMTIRSNPPGALVYVDDYPIGTTPVSTDFIYYGTRKVRLVKDGYETLTLYQPIGAPWYEWPGIDFFSENIWPGEIRDERAFEYQMTPTVQVPNEQLLGRAEQLRANSLAMPGVGVLPSVSPAPGAAPPGTIVPGTPPPAALPPTELPPPADTIAPPSGSPPTYLPPGNTPQSAPPFGAPPLLPPNAPGTF